MKFTLTFKTPDVTDQIPGPIDDNFQDAIDLTEKYIQHGEFIRVEFDTETQSVNVMRIK